MKRRIADASAVDRVPFVDQRFRERVAALEARPAPLSHDNPVVAGRALSCRAALELFETQLESRHIDFCARELKRSGCSFYTISSAGHEGNAAVAAALRNDDPALLHYRSGGFFLQRARQAGLDSAALDVLLGVTASADEPIAGGRHKVFGSPPLWVPPQTSTIGSHLPKAMGMAFGLARAQRLGLDIPIPYDAVVACTFGDASANHSTSTGAINAACWAAYQGLPMPVLFVCEDNGLGISVRTPSTWIADNYGSRPTLRYLEADGLNIAETYDVACEAVNFVRQTGRPAFLHLRVVRLLGHAGSDVETLYRSVDQIEQMEEQDPLIHSARMLVEAGAATPEGIIERYEAMRQRIRQLGEQASKRPKLISAAQIMAPARPPRAGRHRPTRRSAAG